MFLSPFPSLKSIKTKKNCFLRNTLANLLCARRYFQPGAIPDVFTLGEPQESPFGQRPSPFPAFSTRNSFSLTLFGSCTEPTVQTRGSSSGHSGPPRDGVCPGPHLLVTWRPGSPLRTRQQWSPSGHMDARRRPAKDIPAQSGSGSAESRHFTPRRPHTSPGPRGILPWLHHRQETQVPVTSEPAFGESSNLFPGGHTQQRWGRPPRGASVRGWTPGLRSRTETGSPSDCPAKGP